PGRDPRAGRPAAGDAARAGGRARPHRPGARRPAAPLQPAPRGVSAVSALELSGVRKTYVRHLAGGRRLPVLRGVDLSVAAGEMVVVRGPSGSGKSTLLGCVYRSALVDEGRIVLDGALDLAAASEREVLAARRERMAMATQFLQVV